MAVDHLANEGLAAKTVLVGDVMTDVLYQVRALLESRKEPLPLDVAPQGYYVSTIHRPDNTDSPSRLRSILASLASLDRPVLLLAHPRLVSFAERHGLTLEQGSIRVCPPLAYPQLVNAVLNSAGVITDSGGLQKEAFLLRVPCTTIRPETEWVETLESRWNVLVSEDLSILADTVKRPAPEPTDAAPYGDGHAAEKIVDALLNFNAESGRK